MKKVAKIILLNEEKELLFNLRDNKPEISFPNQWGDIGGEVEPGETLLEALKREIKEEISCEVTDIAPLGDLLLEEYNVHMFYFKGKVMEQIENIKVYEGQRAAFFRLEELDKIKIAEPLKNFIYRNKEKIFG